MAFLEIGDHRLHYERLPGRRTGPPLVFLHEGLGSVELWRDFPTRLVDATGLGGFVFSRHGHGWSSVLTDSRNPQFMHVEALEVLPAVLDRLCDRSPFLIGHSDGASIALIHAAWSGRPAVALVLLAPHVFVEEQAVAAITAQRETFLETDLPERMAKYHHDAGATFWGWNDLWLSPDFRGWSITDSLPHITCPVLLIQGLEDEYGTISHLNIVAAGLRGPVESLVLPGARHSPHLDQPEAVVEAAAKFISAVGQGLSSSA